MENRDTLCTLHHEVSSVLNSKVPWKLFIPVMSLFGLLAAGLFGLNTQLIWKLTDIGTSVRVIQNDIKHMNDKIQELKK